MYDKYNEDLDIFKTGPPEQFTQQIIYEQAD